MTQAPPKTDPLRAFLSGKRLAPRVTVDIVARLAVGSLTIDARAVDASEGGALLAISGRAMAAAGLDPGMALMSLHERLGAGFEVQFPALGIVRRSHPVRIATRSGDEEHLFVGCRFEHPLSVPEQHGLGLLGEAETRCTPEWTEPVLLGALPLRVPAGHPVYVLARSQGGPILGPRFAGRLLGVGGTAFAVELHVPRDRGIFELLGRDEVRCEIRDRTGVLWDVTARPAAVRLGGKTTGHLEIGLQAESTPPHALRALLIQRA